MSKRIKTILVIATTITLVGIGLWWGFYQLPDCHNFGGFEMLSPGTGKSCDCSGVEIYYINEALFDGVSASKCIGVMTNIK